MTSDGSGEQLSGRFGGYEIERLIGRGGMGAVYLARQVALGRLVVVKVIARSAMETSLVERFRREALAGAQIDSDHVVKVIEFGHERGRPFIAMEYVDGRSASDVLGQYGRFPPETAAAVVLAAARGLEAAHQAGVVHRDVKPSNILLCRDGRVKISDLGIAKLAGVPNAPPLVPALTAAGAVLGTPAYVAPEQAQSQEVDGRADVYALGVSYYELLTATVPFKGANQIETMTKRLTEDPLPPRQLVPSIPEAHEKVVLALMTRDPAKRPTAARAIALLEALVAKRASQRIAALLAPVSVTARTEVEVAPAHMLAFGTTIDVAPRPPLASTATSVKPAMDEPSGRSPLLTFALTGGAAILLGTTFALFFTRPPDDSAARVRELEEKLAREREHLERLEREKLAGPGPAPVPAPDLVPAPLPPQVERPPDLRAADADKEASLKARALLVAAISLGQPAKVQSARDEIKGGAAFADRDTLLATAESALKLVRKLDDRVRAIPFSRRPGPDAPFEELMEALVAHEMRGRPPTTELDRDLRAACTLVAAAAKKNVPGELFLPRGSGAPSDQLGRLLVTLALEEPKAEERRPPRERPDDRPPGPPDRGPPPR